MGDDRFRFLFMFLDDVEQDISGEAEKSVWIEKCINIKELCDYTVTCSYGDMVLIICMLHDYLKILAEKEGVEWDYYKQRFEKAALRLSAQIGYDYEEAVKKCRKKMEKQESNSDIGEDAMVLATKYGKRGEKKSADENKKSDETGDQK